MICDNASSQDFRKYAGRDSRVRYTCMSDTPIATANLAGAYASPLGLFVVRQTCSKRPFCELAESARLAGRFRSVPERLFLERLHAGGS